MLYLEKDKSKQSGTNPTFLIIGAQKAATTWFYQMLNQHPDIFIPKKKEVNFFNKSYNYSKGLAWYRKQFAGWSGAKAVGEATPNYLWSSSTVHDLKQSSRNREISKLVYHYFPDIKLIVTLRNPVERAVSAFYHHIRARNLSPKANIMDVGEQYGIISMGYYDLDLQEWFKYFSPEQFQIFIYEEDILKNKRETLRRTFNFLEVDDSFIPQKMNEKFNRTEGDLYLYIHYFFPWVAKPLKLLAPNIISLNLSRLKVTDEEKEKIRELYAPHNQRLEQMIQRSLPWN